MICSYNLRAVTDAELLKFNKRIDDKIARRRQQQYEEEQKSKQQREQPKKTEPIRSPTSSTSNPSRSLVNSTAPLSSNEEYSIFRDPPTTTTTRVIQ